MRITYLSGRPVHNKCRLLPERVLVDGDCVRVGEDRNGLGCHLAEVIAGDQGRGHDAPHRKVALVLRETSKMTGSEPRNDHK